jgi:hypothetical protein
MFVTDTACHLADIPHVGYATAMTAGFVRSVFGTQAFESH